MTTFKNYIEESVSDSENNNDIIVWKEFQEGSKEAYEKLYLYHVDGLYKYGMNLKADEELIKDAIHELFLSIWLSRSRLTIPKSVKFYLTASLRRIILKKKVNEFKTEYLKEEKSYGLEESSQENKIIDLQNSALFKKSLEDQLSKLPNRQKEALYLRFFEQMSYEEIMAIMNLDYQIVRNLVYKALKNLRNSLPQNLISLLFVLLLLI